jgi:LmbE family N-acetylglucosaminyl deacetylase
LGQQIPRRCAPQDDKPGEDLARIRADVARCSAIALGVNPPIIFNFPDGKLGDYLRDRSLNFRLVDRIAQEIARLTPDVLVTWGPDGGYGHPDHRMVSNIATQPARAGAPGMPERLFYMYLTEEMIRMANPQRGRAVVDDAPGEVLHGARAVHAARSRGGGEGDVVPSVAAGGYDRADGAGAGAHLRWGGGVDSGVRDERRSRFVP